MLFDQFDFKLGLQIDGSFYQEASYNNTIQITDFLNV